MRSFLAGMVIAAALMAPSLSLASPAFEAMLRQAETVRSSDPAQLDQLIGQLNSSLDAASPRQREMLDYLEAYQLIFTGRLDQGTAAAEELFRSSADPAIRYRVGAMLVYPYGSRRDFAEALRYMNETSALEAQIQDPAILEHGWASFGGLLNQVGRHEDGLRYAERMRTLSPSERSRCFGGVLSMESWYNLKQLGSRKQEIDDIAAQCEAAGEPLFANFARFYRARQMVSEGERNEAAIFLNRHLAQIEASRYPRLIAEVRALLAEINLEAGDIDAADRDARQVIALGAPVVRTTPLVTAYRILYETALQRGNTAAALAHHINYSEADKAYLDETKARAMAYQEVMSETREKNQTIELLNRENQVLQLRDEVSAQSRRNTQLLLALLAVLLGSIAFWAWRTKRSQVKFRQLAETDALTGVSNRMDFTRRAEEALAFCRRDREEVGLVMLDLDEFKAINDSYGHATGDWVLKEVARVCIDVCRKNDRFGRLGGEEFAFLLVGCDLPSSVALAQACRKRIASIDTSPTGQAFHVTASFGVAGTRACGYDFLTLLSRADDALYRAKHDGRDRVRIHGLEADTTTVAAN